MILITYDMPLVKFEGLLGSTLGLIEGVLKTCFKNLLKIVFLLLLKYMTSLRIIPTMAKVIHLRRLNMVIFIQKQYDACAPSATEGIDMV